MAGAFTTAGLQAPTTTVDTSLGDITQPVAQQDGKAKADMLKQEMNLKANEQNLSHEENMSISGRNARYMMMQKLARKNEVLQFFGVLFVVIGLFSMCNLP